MMTLITLILLAVFCLLQSWLISILVKKYNAMKKDMDTLREGYTSLDQGMTEITDAYETDMMQYESTIEALNQEKTEWTEANLSVMRTNSALRGQISAEKDHSDFLLEENAKLNRKVAMSEKVLKFHDENCLPHLPLPAPEEDTEDVPLPLSIQLPIEIQSDLKMKGWAVRQAEIDEKQGASKEKPKITNGPPEPIVTYVSREPLEEPMSLGEAIQELEKSYDRSPKDFTEIPDCGE